MLTIDIVLSTGSVLTIFWPFLVLLGAGIGMLTGLFGVGGGFLLTPCLNIFFGIPFPVAIGSGLLQFFVTAATSAQKHWKRHNVDAKLGALMAAGASAGSLGGQSLLSHLEANVGTVMFGGHDYPALDLIMHILFLILLGFIMTSILRETSGRGKSASENAAAREPASQPDTGTNDEDDEEVSTALSRWLHDLHIPPMMRLEKSGIPKLSVWTPLLVSLFVGILTGLMGVGGGVVLLPVLVYVFGVPTTVAVGTSAFQIVFATGVGAFRAHMKGEVSLLLVAFLLGGSLLGVQLGVYFADRFGGRRIRKYFAFVIALSIAIILFSLTRDFLMGPAQHAS